MRGGVFTCERHRLSQIDDALAIQGERFDRGATGWSRADQQRVIGIPGEVFMPVVPARMIEWNGFAGEGIERGDIIVFAAVATLTSQRQVVLGIRPTSGKRDDVFHGETLRRVGFMTDAVFAVLTGTFPDQIL